MIDIQKAAVYCGTYKKYNEGSLEGAWIYLNDYQTWEDFDAKCREIHKDEVEPEFMFQDAQYLPTELFTEHWVYSEIFQVLSEIRNWSEDKLEALDDWCKETAAIPDMYDIETFEEFYAKKTKKTIDIDADFAEFLNIVESKYKVYTKKDFEGAIKIAPNKFITFGKDIFSLKKSFCWGWSSFGYGYKYDEANKLCDNFNEEDFKKANLSEFDKKFLSKEEIQTNITDWNGILVDSAFCGERKPYEFYVIHPRTYRDACMYNKIKENPLVIDAKFMQVYLNKVAELRAKFEKKIDNYLKKYGVSKIKKWTYCSDD